MSLHSTVWLKFKYGGNVLRNLATDKLKLANPAFRIENRKLAFCISSHRRMAKTPCGGNGAGRNQKSRAILKFATSSLALRQKLSSRTRRPSFV
jgi:hypothetical protein